MNAEKLLHLRRARQCFLACGQKAGQDDRLGSCGVRYRICALKLCSQGNVCGALKSKFSRARGPIVLVQRSGRPGFCSWLCPSRLAFLGYVLFDSHQLTLLIAPAPVKLSSLELLLVLLCTDVIFDVIVVQLS